MNDLIYFDPDELRTKEFNRYIDQLLETGSPDVELHENLTPVQKQVYSVINRAFERYKRRCGIVGTEVLKDSN